jgi:hypothetical protein
MFKWDKLSWIALGIFVTGIILGAVIDNIYLFLLVAAYLLRPTLLAFGGSKEKYADERQIKIQYHSGNIALTVMIIAMIVFAVIEYLQGKPYDTYNELIVIGLLTRALVSLIMIGDYKAAAARIGFFMALLLGLFILFDISSEPFKPIVFLIIMPPVIIAIISYVGLKRPMFSAIFFVALGVIAVILLSLLRNNLPIAARITTDIAISLPLLVEAFLFYKGAKAEKATNKEISD